MTFDALFKLFNWQTYQTDLRLVVFAFVSQLQMLNAFDDAEKRFKGQPLLLLGIDDIDTTCKTLRVVKTQALMSQLFFWSNSSTVRLQRCQVQYLSHKNFYEYEDSARL